jgi:ElaB/YqjD/DUF883 family membrane-anchored ribosome-binding protein
MRAPINRLESIWPQSSREDAIDTGEHASWSNSAKSFEHKIEELLAEHPKLAIGAAAAFGLFLGWLVKRR